MALSGSFNTAVGSNWRLRLVWSATQNVTANTSTVTAKLYWEALNSSGTVSSSATKAGSVTIDGTASAFSGAGLANLTGNQSKLIKTFVKTVTHSSDGSKSINLSAYFDLGITLGGTRYNRITAGGTVVLDSIAKASSLTSSSQASWTAGNDVYYSISRASGEFTHTLKLYVDGTLVKTIMDITNATSTRFTEAEHTEIFNLLAQSSSKATKVDLHTYSGLTLIGSKSYTGTVTAPSRSTTTFSGDFNIGDSIRGTISSNLTAYTHVVSLTVGAKGFRLADYVPSGAWNFDTNTIANDLYDLAPGSSSLAGTLYIYTYYNGVQVGYPLATPVVIQVNKTDSKPLFTGAFAYMDTNSKAVAITGNNQVLIQGVSTTRVILPELSRAVAQNGATMVKYVATLNGEQVVKNHSTPGELTFDFPVITAGLDVTLSIRAVDSRDNYTEQTKTVKVLPYTAPTINRTAQRVNNFESNTKLTASGTISALTVTGVQKNAITQAQYRAKLRNDTAWGLYSNFSISSTGTSYKATDVTVSLDNTKAWDIQIYIADKVTAQTVELRVNSGSPVLFIDSKKKSVGINKFPELEGSFEVGGATKFDSHVTFNSAVVFEDSVSIPVINTDSLNVEGSIYLAGEVYNEDYTLASLQNGWSNFSTTGGYQRASYFKDKNGVVHLTGLIKGGTTTNATVLFTLPVGYRPSSQQIFIAQGSTKVVRLDIQANGNVIGNANLDSTWTSLSGISFRAEQ